VADDHTGEGSVGEQRFEPLDACKIEMVGRLIEQQNIGILHQRLGDREPFSPASGECNRLGIKFFKPRASEGVAQGREARLRVQSPELGVDGAEVAARSSDVADVHALSKNESERLLEPWLGQGLDLSQLPIPRLIVVHMQTRQQAGLESLRAALTEAVPEASLDDHALWLSRLGTMADVIVMFAAALFVLMIIAMATAIGFATRGAMAGNREIIEVLHFVGAEDRYIARQFQTHFMRLGLRGAAIGGSAAAILFLAASLLSALSNSSAGGREIAALFGAFSLTAGAYVAIFVICAAIAALTGLLSRQIVFNHLRQLM